MTQDQKDLERKSRMAVLPEAPLGSEQDEKGNLIPFEKRTCDDQRRARAGTKE